MSIRFNTRFYKLIHKASENRVDAVLKYTNRVHLYTVLTRFVYQRIETLNRMDTNEKRVIGPHGVGWKFSYENENSSIRVLIFLPLKIIQLLS